MALWGKNEQANNAPKAALTQLGLTANSVMADTLFVSGYSAKANLAGAFTVNATSANLTAVSGNTAAMHPGQVLYLANTTANTTVTISAVTNSTSAVMTTIAASAVTSGNAISRVKQGSANVGIFGVSAAEAANTSTRKTSAGWVLRKELPNGRVQTECLVAMKSITGTDTDGSTF